MTKKQKLYQEIVAHFDGIAVQFQDIARQNDPLILCQKRHGVFATMKMVGELIRQHDDMPDDA
jgi:hypothetical protein